MGMDQTMEGVKAWLVICLSSPPSLERLKAPEMLLVQSLIFLPNFDYRKFKIFTIVFSTSTSFIDALRQLLILSALLLIKNSSLAKEIRTCPMICIYLPRPPKGGFLAL